MKTTQLESIKNAIATINRYSDYLLETRIITDQNDWNLIKLIDITTWKDGQITGSRRIENKKKDNREIVQYFDNLYCAYMDLGLISFNN